MPAKRKGKPAWDAAPSTRKTHANAKVKNLPDEAQEELWLLLHPTDTTVPPYTLEAAMVHLLDEHGVECALSTFSEWHSWYALKMRMEKAAARAQQATLEFAKAHPDATPDDLEKYGQMIFSAESIEHGDAKTFTALMRERSRRMSLEIDSRRIVLLEKKAKAADEAAELKRQLNAGGKLMPAQEREAILDKMDEILGLKK